MADADETPRVLHPARLSRNAAQPVRLVPGDAERGRIAARLGLSALRKLRFEGELVPEDRADWRLRAVLGATVVQPCVVSLAPVTTRIDTSVTRTYRTAMPLLPPGGEIEMPEDDTEEPLPETLDLAAVMEEALALALPLYPRAAGAEMDEPITAAPPGVAPLRDADLNPFAALSRLKRPADD